MGKPNTARIPRPHTRQHTCPHTPAHAVQRRDQSRIPSGVHGSWATIGLDYTLAPRTPIPAAPSRATLALVTACVGVVGQRQCGVEHRIRALGLVTGHVLASVRTVDLVPLFAHVLGCALVTIAGGPRREWPAWRVPLCDAMRTTGARLRFFGDETLSPITVLEPCWHHLLGWWAEYEIWAAAPPVPGWGYADTAPGSSVSAVPQTIEHRSR